MPTKEELEEELAEVQAAISAIRKGGQSYMITSGSSTRQVMAADYDKLVKERSRLLRQIQAIDGEAGITIGASW